MQFYNPGRDFFHWNETFAETGRATSTFGQTNYLATYLLIVVPLAGYLFLRAKNYLFKIIYSILILLELIALYLSVSLTAWCALVVGIIWFAVFCYFLIYKKKQVRNEIAPSAGGNSQVKKLLLAGLIILSLAGIAYQVQKNPIVRAKVDYVRSGQGSMATRLQLWRAGWEAFKERPLLGYGPDTQREVLVKYYRADWAIWSDVNVRPSRAHNFILDTLLTSGLLGLASYLLLIAYFFYLMYKNIRSGKHPLFNLIISTILISYLAFLFFNFFIFVSEVYFWLFLAAVIAINSGYKIARLPVFDSVDLPDKEPALAPPAGPARDVPLNSAGPVGGDESAISHADHLKNFNRAIVILFIILGSGFWIFLKIDQNLKAYITDHYFLELKQTRARSDYYTTLVLWDYIKENSPGYDYYDTEFATLMSGWLYDFPWPRLAYLGEDKLKDILTE